MIPEGFMFGGGLTTAVEECVKASERRESFMELGKAVNEAHGNCEILGGVELGVLDWGRCENAVLGNPLVHEGCYGELDGLLGVLRLLRLYGDSGEVGRARLLEAKGYNKEDIRFLAGFVHWYLNLARRHYGREFGVSALLVRGHDSEQGARNLGGKAFRNLDFGEFLGLLD